MQRTLRQARQFSTNLLLAVVALAGLVAIDQAPAQEVDSKPRDGLLNGAPDPTGVAVTNAGGATTYYVAATGRGVKLLSSTDLKHWTPSGRVFDQPVPDWARRAIPRHSRDLGARPQLP